MAKKSAAPVAATVKARKHDADAEESALSPTRLRSSALVDPRVIYCGDNLEQLKKLPGACVDLTYIDPPAWPKPLRRGEGPPFNSNRNYEVFWSESKEKRSFEGFCYPCRDEILTAIPKPAGNIFSFRTQ